MKKLFFLSTLTLFLFSLMTGLVNAQNEKRQKEIDKEAAIKTLIDSRHYSFQAQTALPLSMAARQLTTTYEVKIRKDSIDAYLPYFGRAYTATIGSSGDGITFKTTDFKYTATPARKGGWNIVIEPKKAGDTRQLTLYVSKTGYASLQVFSNSKQAISFNGYVE